MRQTACEEGKVYVVVYTNFIIPGIEEEGTTHDVCESESGQTGVISLPHTVVSETTRLSVAIAVVDVP
jgi:hypothetical protein